MDELAEKVSILCQELGQDVPDLNSKGEYILKVDALEMVLFQVKAPQSRWVILVSLGTVPQWLESRGGDDVADLLTYLMRLHAARVKHLGLECVLTLEDESVVLWQSLEPHVSVPDFLLAAETLLNEAEYWHQNLSAATV